MSNAHAILSPSSAARWMHCAASPARNAVLPDHESESAREGTAAHELAQSILEGRPLAVGATTTNGWVVTEDMHREVRKYTRYIGDLLHSTQGQLMVEVRVPISTWTGEADATGTSDAVVICDELIVVDLKFGRGIKVDAPDNPQLMLYALGVHERTADFAEYENVRLVIHQPRLDHVSEHVVSVTELLAFGEQVRAASIRVRAPNPVATPGDKACTFCKAAGTCPELAALVAQTTKANFQDVAQTELPPPADHTQLSACMSKIAMIERWCKAVRAETERALLASEFVEGWKLVQGKRGNRKWDDETGVEALFKSLRIKKEDMYDYSLISPTSAEKLAKANTIGPRQWAKLSGHVTQSEGGLSVAPSADPRPEVKPEPAAPQEFDDLTSIF